MKKHLLLLLVAFCTSCSGLWAQIPTFIGCVGAPYDFGAGVNDMYPFPIHFWTSSDTSVATIDSATGIAHAVAPGTTSIYYNGPFSFATLHFTVYPALLSVTGSDSMCVGSSISLSNSVLGGIWSSDRQPIATVDSISGVVMGVHAGSTNIVYMNAGSCATHAVHVVGIDADSSLFGFSDQVCIGSTISLTPGWSVDTVGTWSSSNAAVATVTGSSPLHPVGVVEGLHAGTATISYSFTTVASTLGCATTYIRYRNIAVIAPLALSAIGGAASVCQGSSITLTNTLIGGYWSSSNPAIALLHGTSYSPPSVIADGVSAGNATIVYRYTGMCASTYINDSAITTITVLPPDTPGTISGPASVTAGSTIVLSNTVTGGVWSVLPSSVATIDAATGILSGVGAGTALVTYTVTGTCGSPVSSTYTVVVMPLNIISGNVYLTAGGAYTGDIKVWLIKYVSPMLTAVDSVVIPCTGTSVSYQFIGALTDSYRIKAALVVPPTGTTGYIPTYHNTSFYWNTADVLLHTAGTVDGGQNIVMDFGVATIGPGFIGGDVTTGANKGTLSGVPVSGLMMYVFNATSMQLMQSVRTDATGHYSFSNLPAGETYYIFPDSLNYFTTPFAGINLTWGNPTMHAANFVQHTLSHTITPDTALKIDEISIKDANFNITPNPTASELNILWQVTTAQTAAVIINDVTGRVVYKTRIDLATGAGNLLIDISSLENGLYTLTIRSDEINYNTKVQVQH